MGSDGRSRLPGPDFVCALSRPDLASRSLIPAEAYIPKSSTGDDQGEDEPKDDHEDLDHEQGDNYHLHDEGWLFVCLYGLVLSCCVCLSVEVDVCVGLAAWQAGPLWSLVTIVGLNFLDRGCWDGVVRRETS